MTRDEALVLLRSGQMPEHRFFQLCDESGWQMNDVVPQLLTEIGNALDDKDAEIASLRADLQVLRGVAAAVGDQNWSQGKIIFDAADEVVRLRATIADLTAALTTLKARWPNFFGAEDHKIIDAALARAQGGKE